ncbi:Protein of unknown function [Salinimicrobium catena]|uniref:DUF3347 domain-containing protein n=1 Tax=Salinimicrobium catena TaxID=390640 RepID=A0A1H5HQE7_9FLAO|nr:DUF3347 domain-containing protein [Salinimicrobium catena]SDK71958.1 Protein of unknown function [Salinimicrobium catena]SEE30236.1 Protein of unknown function [Salinimicrobium catena]
MKSLFKTTIIALMFISMIGCKEKQTVEINTPEEVKKERKETADIADQHFIDGMTGKVWHNYLEIKMALTLSDADQVQQTAKVMAETFSQERAEMKSLAQQMSETDDIEVQRELFAKFTEKAGPMFEDALSGGTIYKKFCPMAFDNKGAYWYASIEEISNPYFGEKMPKCGSVEKTISK